MILMYYVKHFEKPHTCLALSDYVRGQVFSIEGIYGVSLGSKHKKVMHLVSMWIIIIINRVPTLPFLCPLAYPAS